MTTEQHAATEDNNLTWVQKHPDALVPYQGKWIAVLNRAVITSAEAGEDVVDYLEKTHTSGALLYRVPDDVHRKIYVIG